jgi:Na+-driven multidrug efflux pump
MRKRTVKTGLNLILAGIVSLVLASFYHEHIARLLFLSPGAEILFVYLGFFFGCLSGCVGISVTLFGLARSAGKAPYVSLSHTIILLLAALIIYGFLFYASLTNTDSPKLQPGETITI